MVRSQMNFKRLSLTDIKIDIKRVPRKKELIEAMKAAGTLLNLIFTYKCSLPLRFLFSCLLVCFNLLFWLIMSDVQKKWEDSSWGRKLLVKKRRASLNDFDRFKLMLAKIKVSDNVIQSIVCTFFLLPFRMCWHMKEC